MGDNGVALKTAEKYDYLADAWSQMPSMVSEGVCHLVAVKSKLFAIKQACEVYDSRAKKFAVIKTPPSSFKFDFVGSAGAVSMGSKIVVFQKNLKMIACYDMEENRWSEEAYENKNSIEFDSCVKML